MNRATTLTDLFAEPHFCTTISIHICAARKLPWSALLTGVLEGSHALERVDFRLQLLVQLLQLLLLLLQDAAPTLHRLDQVVLPLKRSLRDTWNPQKFLANKNVLGRNLTVFSITSMEARGLFREAFATKGKLG